MKEASHLIKGEEDKRKTSCGHRASNRGLKESCVLTSCLHQLTHVFIFIHSQTPMKCLQSSV